MDLYRHCICPVSYLNYVFSIYNVKYDNKIGGIPAAIIMLCICILPVGCAPIMHGFSMMTSRQSDSPIGREGKSQTTHCSIMVECVITLR